jgi:hypothetical protein
MLPQMLPLGRRERRKGRRHHVQDARQARRLLLVGYVNIRVDGVENGAGCLLFVRDGVLSFLEGYTYGGAEWPQHPVVMELREPSRIASLPEST